VPVLEKPVTADDIELPILTDPAGESAIGLTDKQLAVIQAELTSLTRELTDALLDSAMRDMEAALFETVSNRLRDELPTLIERVLRDNLKPVD
ncbi:MAG: hypothetical protein AMJ59_26280, partial [Gammaproteobacteria bacterium SG8_31]